MRDEIHWPERKEREWERERALWQELTYLHLLIEELAETQSVVLTQVFFGLPLHTREKMINHAEAYINAGETIMKGMGGGL